MELYFISKGDCSVNLKDFDGEEHVAYKLLVEGNHFGEISLLFGCDAQATVVSRNYNTFACVQKVRFINFITEYPNYKNQLLKHIYKYKDPNK